MNIRTSDFNLEATLDSAQVFGFSKNTGGVYSGVLEGHPVRIWQKADQLHVKGRVRKKMVSSYFDLNRDMSPVYDRLSSEERLQPLVERFRGLRIIRQNRWEALAGFILSQNNNFKRIQGIWKKLCCALGPDELNFPDIWEIARASEKQLRELGLGYRAPYLRQTARLLADHPEFLDRITNSGYEEAKELVMTFPGVGAKVADCVLLYGFQKYEAFPVDVWIHRMIQKLYFRNRKISEKKAAEFGRRRWEHLAGFVQQFLFHGARIGIL